MSEPCLGSEEELVDRFRRRIVIMVMRRTGDPTAAEDVAQEALRRVLEALRRGRLENPDALPAFVFQTARHVLLHRQRSGARGDRALGRLAREPDGPAANEASLLALIDSERRRQVRAALDQLEEDDRQLLVWSFYEDLDPAEMAKRLEIKAGTVRVRKHRALQRLRQLLERTEEAGESPR